MVGLPHAGRVLRLAGPCRAALSAGTLRTRLPVFGDSGMSTVGNATAVAHCIIAGVFGVRVDVWRQGAPTDQTPLPSVTTMRLPGVFSTT